MQKKHLQLLLLILILGCSKPQLPEQNPYTQNKQHIDLSFGASGKSKTVSLLGSELRIAARQARGQSLYYRNPLFLNGDMIFEWVGGLPGNEDLLDIYSCDISRSLSGLHSATADSSLEQWAIPLPSGSGLVVYLEGERPAGASVLLTERVQTYSTQPVTRVDEKTFRLRTDDLSSFLVMAGNRGLEKISQTVPLEFRVDLSKKTTQLVLSFGSTADAAQKISERYLGKSRKEVEAAVCAELQSDSAFTLVTGDDRTNQAFALMQSCLIGVSNLVTYKTRDEIESNSQLATGIYLASRQRPALTFPDSSLADSHFTATQHLLWGWRSHQVLLKYGMADEKTLSDLSNDVMAELSVLQEDLQLEKNTLDDDAISDSLLRRACSHVQLAGLFTLGEEIARSAGNNIQGDDMRKQELIAMKTARRCYTDYGKRYDRWEKKKTLSKLEAIVDDSSKPQTADTDIVIQTPLARDSLSFVLTGARAGFNWLSENPDPLVFASPVDGFIWQKYLAYHFSKDLRVTQSDDLDSLLSILLNGRNPGLVTMATDEGDTLPDYLTMAAAFQNFAEVYLGYHPEWRKHHVDLYPRIPPSWGHTAARLPFGPGFIHLEYDFLHERARIGMTGIQDEMSFVFGYPLESSGSLTTQFKLSKERPRVEITLIHKKDKMLEIEINDAN